MELFAPLQGNLERFALAMTRDSEMARDLVAETTLIAYERFETLRSNAAFLSFLFTIAVRVNRGQQTRERRMEPIGEHHIRTLLDPGIAPDRAADISAVYAGLQQLPEKQREGVVLFEIMGLSMKEIRDIQGGSLTAVKVRISRGRKRLAEILGVTDQQESVAGSPSNDVESKRADQEGLHRDDQ